MLQRQDIEKRIPVEGTNLTAKERALLPDPNWFTEDDADAIMSMRAFKQARGRSYSLEEVLRENGISLERTSTSFRASATPKARSRRKVGSR